MIKCQECGRFIPYSDLDTGKAISTLIVPDSELTRETYEVLCKAHYEPNESTKGGQQ